MVVERQKTKIEVLLGEKQKRIWELLEGDPLLENGRRGEEEGNSLELLGGCVSTYSMSGARCVCASRPAEDRCGFGDGLGIAGRRFHSGLPRFSGNNSRQCHGSRVRMGRRGECFRRGR